MTFSTAPLSRRSLLVGLLGLPALAAVVAACGDPSSESAGTEPGGSTPGIAHPTGADDAVVRVWYEGGFAPPLFDFGAVPVTLIGGNGVAYQAAPMTMQYPGPLVAPVSTQTITEAGTQKVLQLAASLGLLATPPEYVNDTQIADAPNTIVVLSAGGQVYEHRAYALGISGDEKDAKRKALADFVAKVADLASVAGGGELGPSSILEPTAYRVRSMVVTPEELASITEPAPTTVPWPASAGVDLATATTCAKVSAEQAGSLFADATAITFFSQGDVTYRVAVAPALPGDPTC